MNCSTYHVLKSEALELDQFKAMDYYAVENYNLPIELLMENAGLHLARLIASCTLDNTANITIGIGNGNNGGGGLVAARRLLAWGYSVNLDINETITKELPQRQLERATLFGATTNQTLDKVDVWVDAYLGFSQRLPLPEILAKKVGRVNQMNCVRISLDIPTGFLGDDALTFFKADKVLTLAAPKRILYELNEKVEIYVADLGIPSMVYEIFEFAQPPFAENSILSLVR